MKISGHFKKYRSNFSAFDNGEYLDIQITKKCKHYTFEKLKENLRKKPFIIVQSSISEIAKHHYHIVSVIWNSDSSITMFYDYRIDLYSDKGVDKMIFNSVEINKFGQTNDYYLLVNDLIDGKAVNLNSFKFSKEIKIGDMPVILTVYNELDRTKYYDSSLSFKTNIEVKANKTLQDNEIYTIYKTIKILLSFLCKKRTLNVIDVCLSNSIEKCCGDLYVKEGANNNNETIFDIVNISDIYPILENLINLIDSKILTLDYINDDDESLRTKFISATCWVNDLYRKYASLNPELYECKRINIHKKHINENGELVTDKNRVSYETMVKELFEYANKNDIVKNFVCDYLPFYRLDIESYFSNLSSRIKNNRNALCHGFINDKSNDYKFLECDLWVLLISIYVSIFRYLNLDENLISKSIKDLFSISLIS